ncbi:hypothetical protein COV42_02120 [Candidatus Campbellbacteria bacterium CG11_big_fil_rev_8_21_14_0_20_44_21]|uniref:UDP-N-acetylmuramoyl-L-alanyl-D-glutamate--2, 6-diaminopimelate ligase n=1 Tax=Candidatus Campbellbacteria bacterium CG22_combo_CG10-13_8_21_14_all_43_18 TaxID=1974530 RepID=A0A2H0DWE6_9BACT|nr:MAG: hypothetical protein COW82_01735 [Candidatus Campbellbacteria bacterium CG22_combo_CG10-13_8_21_14_all_43_18]PIR24222.1 MAG: hypothetical protein COV42_02120 [Candidatus Campbellbacteria bacterium CG11_big_fil_rev_8_21_14_0_20_44_21]
MTKIGKEFSWLEKILRFFEKLIPKKLYSFGQPIYHYALALLAAVFYRFPSRKINIVAVTGTKGKTTTAEIINAIFEEAGFKTALADTLRFKVGNKSERNMYKMSLRGRFFTQRFLKRALEAGCDYAIIEITSEAAKQYRHKFISLNALLFTNLAPEHIESHGSYDKYVEAKLSIAKALRSSRKKRRVLVANKDDKESEKFLALNIQEKYKYGLDDAKDYRILPDGLAFYFENEKFESKLHGKFNIYNILAALTYAKTQNISPETMRKAIEKFSGVKGRVEFIEEGQNFKVVVDYAHTPDSLQKLYDVFQDRKKICVLGNTGGGRDKWKRAVMAEIAEKNCAHIILTNEDPYDENPREIVDEMARAIASPVYEIKIDRREAIREALRHAEQNDVVLITGKGTDPYIMGPNNAKMPWSDSEVAREEIRKLYKPHAGTA